MPTKPTPPNQTPEFYKRVRELACFIIDSGQSPGPRQLAEKLIADLDASE